MSRFRRLQGGIHLLVVVSVSAAAHWAILKQGRSHFTGDTASYIEPARSFLRDGSFTTVVPMSYVVKIPADPIPRADTIRTPGYPLFLALNRLDLDGALHVQHLIDVVLAALIYLFARKTLQSDGAALVAALLYALWLPTLLITDQWMSDSLFAFFFAIACAWAYAAASRVSIGHAMGAGALLGVSVLIRPIGVFFFVPLTFIVAMKTRRAAVVAMFLVASLALPAGWALRNYRATGIATVSSINAENLLFFRAGGAVVADGDSLFDNVTVLQRQFGFFNRLFRAQPLLLDASMMMAESDGVDPRRTSHAVRARYFSRLALILIRPRLETVTAQWLSGALEFWITGLSSAASEIFELWTARVVFVPLAIVLAAIAGLGMVELRRCDQPLFWIIASIAVYFTAISAGPGDDLYRLFAPVAPAFTIAVAAGVKPLVNHTASLARRQPGFRRSRSGPPPWHRSPPPAR